MPFPLSESEAPPEKLKTIDVKIDPDPPVKGKDVTVDVHYTELGMASDAWQHLISNCYAVMHT